MKQETQQASTQHTPGPWSADKWAPGWTVSAPKAQYSVCHLADCNNAEPNARLIAAAPELLEACRALVSWAEYMGGFESGEWTQAATAIAKATGKGAA